MSLPPPRRLRTQWWLVAVLVSALVVALTLDRTTQRLDNLVYDHLLRLLAPAPPRSGPVLLVEIDDDSLARVGRWPWDRRVHAALLDRLHADGARAIAYDVLFAEPGDPAADAALGRAIGAAGRVYLPALPGPAGPVNPIAPVARGATGLGLAAIEPDGDGVVRSARAVMAGATGDQPVPHLMAALARGLGADMPRTQSRRLIPFDRRGAGWSEVSAAALLAGEVPPELVRGRAVVVGVTATGLGSRYATPIGGVVSGLEVEASLLRGLLDGTLIAPARPWARLALALVPLWALMLALGPLRRLPALAATGLAAAMVVGLSGLALVLARLWLPPGAALAGIAVAYPLWGWRQLAVIEQFMHDQLAQLAREPALLPQAAPLPAAGGTGGFAATLTLLDAAITRTHAMQHFTADRFDQLPDATLVTDHAGQVVLANAAAHRLFGSLNRPVAPGMAAATLLACFRATDRNPLPPFPPTGDSPVTTEVQIDAARFYMLALAGQHTPEGRCAGWIVRLADISEAKAAQRQRDDVVHLLTHDMRSPQASILAVLETAPETRIHPAEARAIRHYAERTLLLADGFVQLARAENLDYVLEEIALGDILMDAIDDLWPQSHAKSIEIVTCGGGELIVSGERSLLTRALVNVIGNAIKYSPPDTRITCTLTRQVRDDGSAWAQCAVADQGPGIDAALQAGMFERFRRGAIGLAPRAGGAGLGLSFVHTVMVRHHGTVACVSAPGEGAIFTLGLPLIA